MSDRIAELRALDAAATEAMGEQPFYENATGTRRGDIINRRDQAAGDALPALLAVAEAAQRIPNVQKHTEGRPCISCPKADWLAGTVSRDNPCEYRTLSHALTALDALTEGAT